MGQKCSVGVVGAAGVVGGATFFGFQKLGHEAIGHDIRWGTALEDLFDTELVFICVPTPMLDDGSCDTRIVENTVKQLKEYKGIIVIKSTIPPGSTQKLIEEVGRDICFVPEFLRERCAFSDFVEHHKLLAVGTHSDESFARIVDCHGDYPQSVLRMNPTEAELLKYYHNSLNALRVVAANSFYEICQKLGVSYDVVKSGVLKSLSLPDIYLDVNSNMRGYGGTCLRKDVPAMDNLVRKLGLDVKLFQFMVTENTKFKTTVFPGMRER